MLRTIFTAKRSPCLQHSVVMRQPVTTVTQQAYFITVTDTNKNKSASYWTDNQLFTTDVSTDFKVTWHKN